jgi:LacI family transcriptional regulator
LTKTAHLKGKPATLRDVARHAGVSHTTVSRVINGEDVVTTQTRHLVQEAIAALRFTPNPVARALSGGEQVRIGLLHRFPNPGSLGEFLVQLIDDVNKAHAHLVLYEVPNSGAHEAAVDEMVSCGVRGVVLPPPLADDPGLLARLEDAGIVVVATGSHHQGHRLSSVGVDDRRAAYSATELLLSLGHRRIGFITGDPHYASADLRLAGYRDALASGGLPVEPDLIASGRFTYQTGLEAADRLISLKQPPTAIFASNDDMAAACVAVAHRHGIDVPNGLSVCGFDDSPLATTIWPTLTTVRRPIHEMTHHAVRLLLSELSSGKRAGAEKQHIVLEHAIVRRQSDGPPPKG